ncbi:MAG: hypothetical protein ACK4EY_02525 [Flavipsychrobacter sp.]
MHKKNQYRLSNIQKQLGVAQSGLLDAKTIDALLHHFQIKPLSSSPQKCIAALQKKLILHPDGILGSATLTTIERNIDISTTTTTNNTESLTISKKAFDFIIDSEISSKFKYNRNYKFPTWAGGYSGVTIGIGFDCGYCSKIYFYSVWSEYLKEKELIALSATCGIKGAKCKALIPALKHIEIPYETAVTKFYDTVLPACARDVKRTYPGVEKLPPDTQGAILSLVYNRGYLINDTDRRKEMKALKPIIAAGDLPGIAAQLRSMKRLWDSKKQKGLITRRENEALLAENGTFNILPENTIVV